MANTSHDFTPGPWKISEVFHISVVKAGNKVIASFEEGAEGRANAHLIAASPELLEALEIAADTIERITNMPARTARAAIAKAKGDS